MQGAENWIGCYSAVSEKQDSWDLLPEKFVRTTHRMSDNILVQNKIEIVFIIDFYVDEENGYPNLFLSTFDSVEALSLEIVE